MDDEQFHYEERVQEALRGVVRDVLKDAVTNGLASPHHFYITFSTTYPGVDLPDFVKRTNPEEITIVLQHQFWDLAADEQGFSVVLSFQDISKKIYVPYHALLSFMDPSVRFGLHFTPPELTGTLMPDTQKSPDATPEQKKSSEKEPAPKDKDPKGAKIISFDQFRKTET